MRTAAFVAAVALALGSAFVRTPAAPPEKAGKTALDESIDKALEFLATTQAADGSWSPGADGRRPRAGGRGSGHAAISSLAVMAFLSAGHVPGEGPYGENVEKGVRYVMSLQQANGLLCNSSYGEHEMYHHGICTLMLAEVVGMTQGKLADEVRAKLEKAIALTLRAQRTTGEHRGGWRYRWNSDDSDLSVTGWQLMSLRAAKNLGCDVPPEAIERAVDYVKRCYDSGSGGFRYMTNSRVTVGCTGTGILSLELAGKEYHRSADLLKAGTYLLDRKRGEPLRYGQSHFFYGTYYCSQAMFQLGGNYWSSFRTQLHDLLLKNQSTSGAWTAGGGDDGYFGANYCTAMGVLALTVEYRFLPIYQRDEGPSDKSDKD
jgi:hypothetical protein